MSEYKIIKLLDNTTYISNIPKSIVSSRKDIEFIIYYKGDEIVDPETGDSLGKLEITKERCYLVDSQENFTVIRDISERKSFLAQSIIANGFLSEDTRDMTRYLPEKEKRVKVGDYIKLI